MKKVDHDQGEIISMDHPEGPDQKLEDAPHNAQEPDESNKQINQSKDEVDYTNHPEGRDKNFNDAQKYDAPKSNQSKKQINQSKDEVDYMDHPKGTIQNFKGAPQNEALELDQPNKQIKQTEDIVNYLDHPEGPDNKFKGAPQNEVSKQMVQSEGEVDHMDNVEDHGQKFRGTPQHDVAKYDQSDTEQSLQPIEEVTPPGLGPNVASEVEDKTNDAGKDKKSEDSPSRLRANSKDPGKGEIVAKKKHFWSNWPVIGDACEASVPEQPKTDSSKKSDLTAASQAVVPNQPAIDLPDEKKLEHIEVNVDEVDTGLAQESVAAESTPLAEEAVTAVQSLEILKSVVYGGLIESLASLTVVTSAASADAITLNIVALSIANLIGGFFVLCHNLEELKSEQVDRYNELLGERKNFIIHALIAMLSFIVFGLVPPVVYGVSFRESDDKDFKVAAVAGASLLCITLLSLGKAYIGRPNSYLTYFKTVLYYVTTGVVASVLSYLAGDLVKKFIEKLGWFESASNFAMEIPGVLVYGQPDGDHTNKLNRGS